MSRPVRARACPYIYCQHHGQAGEKNIVRHGFFNSKAGKRRRYRCTTCRRTFSSNSGSVYHGIQYSRDAFDKVVLLSVEGLNRSAIARVCGLSWDTVARLIALLLEAEDVRDSLWSGSVKPLRMVA